MSLLFEMLTSVWFWVDVALSCSGAVLVYWGLKIEKRAETLLPPADFKPDIFEDVIAPYKAEMKRGWRVLMTGIGIEVVAALVISVISGLEIADSKIRIAQLEKDREQLRTIGESAKESAAVAIKEAEKAKTEREIAESGRLEMQAKVLELELKQGPRTIRPKQAENLVACLSQWTGTKGPILTAAQHFINGEESKKYSEQIEEVLIESGFRPPPASEVKAEEFNIMMIPESGVLLLVRQPDSPTPLALALKKCFTENGVLGVGIRGLGGRLNSISDTNLVVVWVSSKP